MTIDFDEKLKRTLQTPARVAATFAKDSDESEAILFAADALTFLASQNTAKQFAQRMEERGRIVTPPERDHMQRLGLDIEKRR